MVTNDGLLPVLSSGDLYKFLSEALQKDLTGWAAKGMLLRSYGTIINLNNKKTSSHYNKYYGVIVDADGHLEINAEKHLLHAFQDGDFIELIGYPTINVFKGTVSIRLELLDARLAHSTQQPQRRNNQAQLQQLHALKRTRNAFPLSTKISLDLIHSAASSALVDKDFYQALDNQKYRCQIQAIPIRITLAEAIVSAIEQSQADILVIIRGGGPDLDFAVFNDQRVLKALSEKKSYRVIGIGHSANTTLLDFVADYTASVPAEAGRHIKEQLQNVEHLIKKYEATLEQSNKKIQSLSYHINNMKNQTQHSMSKDQKSEAHKTNNLFLYVVIAILIVILLFK